MTNTRHSGESTNCGAGPTVPSLSDDELRAHRDRAKRGRATPASIYLPVTEVNSAAIRIVIVENHRLVADALEALLNQEADMVVVGSMDSVAETAKRASALNPDVVILDFRLHDGTAVDAAKAIDRTGCTPKVIFLTRDESDTVLVAAIEVGASAVLYKSRASADVIACVRTVAHGATLIHPGTIAALLKKRRMVDAARQTITDREMAVLSLMAEGAASRDIAARLGISYVTVRTHVRNVAGKLGAHNKLEVLARARKLDLVNDGAADVTVASLNRGGRASPTGADSDD
jgi:DNA-binding NarL/FixJ family response regulator